MTNTDTETTLAAVLRWISFDSTTEDIKRMITVINERQKVLRKVDASLTAALLNIGDTVEVKEVSPKYLIGERGTVTSIDGSKVSINIGHRVGKYGPTLTGPASIFRKVGG
jgi:hypothetical protein